MTPLMPWGLVALAAVPAVIAIHLYRRRLRERRVAGLFLFGADDLIADAGRVRTRLLRSPSLWCEITAALLLSALLAGLSWGDDARRAHVVLVLDDSASMQALDGNEDGAARARRAAAEIAAEAGRDALATVVVTGERPELLFGPRGAATLVADALGAWVPRKPRHDPSRALALALEIAGPADRVVLVTDEPTAAVPPRVETRGVGVATINDALLDVRRLRRSATEETVLADVGAFGGGPRRTTVRLLSGEDAATAVVLGEESIELTPGKIARATFRGPRSNEAWRVVLPPDALRIDDEAPLLPEPRRPVRFADLLPSETSALLRLGRALGALDDVERAPVPADADLVFAAAPGRVEGGRTEVVVRPAGETRSDWIGPFLFDRRHPITSGLSLQGVVWSAGDDAVAGSPLVSAGDAVLLAEERASDGVRLLLNLDASRSNLPQAPDWPVLIANLADRVRRTLPGAVAINVRVGEEMTWRRRGAAVDAASYRLTTPDGRALEGRGIGVLGFVGDRPGVYRLHQAENEIGRFAVRFADARESDLSSLSSRRAPAATPPRAEDDAPGERGGGRDERRLLGLLLLVAVVADWIFLRRGGAA
jgi:hypothetical protein